MRKKQIIDESFKLFARQGYEPTTMQQIGEAVGLDKSSLYVHFKKKGDIYIENLAREYQAFEQRITSIPEFGFDVKTQLRTLFVTAVEYFADRDRLLFWKQVVLLGKSSTHDEMAVHSARYVNKIIACMRNKMTYIPTDEKTKLMSLCSAILAHGCMDWFLLTDGVDEHIMGDVVNIYDNIVTTSQLFN